MGSKPVPGLIERVKAALYFWSGRVHRHYGLTSGDKDEFLSAVEDYGRAVKLDPSLSYAYLERGILLWRELGRAGHAIRDLSAALNLRPNWPDALFNRGLAYQATGNYQAAMADLTAYLEQGDNKWRHDAANQLRQLGTLFDGKTMPQGDHRDD